MRTKRPASATTGRGWHRWGLKLPEHIADRPDLDYAGLFDASPNPYLVLDRALNIVGANRAYLDATKRDLAELVGRWAWDAFPTDPETLRQSVASFERVLRTDKPETMALLRFDIPRPEAEGGGFEERYWSIVHAPVLDADGKVALVLQHPIDVTELQRLRDAVQYTGEERRLQLKPAQSGIFGRAQAVYQANLSLQAEGDRLRGLFEQAPGQGTTMRLYLPRHEHAQEEPPAPAAAPAGAGQGETVLLVEDEAGVRAIAAEHLRDLGYAVLEAEDGPAALRLLRSVARVDVLVTDVGLPGGMNGRQVADAARERRPGLPALLIKGYVGNVLKDQLAPGMEVIGKPFALDALAARVRAMLEALAA
jgi:CheY-like chemotaxis protein